MLYISCKLVLLSNFISFSRDCLCALRFAALCATFPNAPPATLPAAAGMPPRLWSGATGRTERPAWQDCGPHAGDPGGVCETRELHTISGIG